MGQAKARGTYEHRKATAIAKREAEAREQVSRSTVSRATGGESDQLYAEEISPDTPKLLMSGNGPLTEEHKAVFTAMLASAGYFAMRARKAS